MTKLEQAARQALDFIDYFVFNGDNAAKAKSISTALREALSEQAEGVIVKTCPDGYGTITTEQAEQEPVAIDGLARACNLAGIDYKDFLRIKAYLPIAAPVRTKDLTDDEIEVFISEHRMADYIYRSQAIAMCRAVIAADREKNK